MSILNIRDVNVSFGGIQVLSDVSLSVKRGGIVGLIGTNGAGKSTLFSVITGFLSPDNGTVEFDGHLIDGLPDFARAQRGLVRTSQVPQEFAYLSVLENILAAGQHHPGESLMSVFLRPNVVASHERKLVERAEEIIEFLNLKKVARESAGRLSGGQKKLLEIGRLLMLEPSCMLLDEPFAGVNPVLIEELGQKIRELNDRGVSILVIEHNLQALAKIVEEMYVMDNGRVIAHGQPSKLLEDELVREAYMGGML